MDCLNEDQMTEGARRRKLVDAKGCSWKEPHLLMTGYWCRRRHSRCTADSATRGGFTCTCTQDQHSLDEGTP